MNSVTRMRRVIAMPVAYRDGDRCGANAEVVCHSLAVRDIPNRLQGAACRILSVKLIFHKGEMME